MKYLIIITLFTISCTHTSKTRMNSYDIENTKERVKILEKEIIKKSDIQDAEFSLFNSNGFVNSRHMIPGASSWDYQFVVKVKPSETMNWIVDFYKTDGLDYDLSWTNNLIASRKNNWKTTSEPQLYKRNQDNTIIVIYQEEGIVFKRVVAN